MSKFKPKMHQIRFRLGLRSRPRWGSLQRGWGSAPDPAGGAYSVPPDPLTGIIGSRSRTHRSETRPYYQYR